MYEHTYIVLSKDVYRKTKLIDFAHELQSIIFQLLLIKSQNDSNQIEKLCQFTQRFDAGPALEIRLIMYKKVLNYNSIISCH